MGFVKAGDAREEFEGGECGGDGENRGERKDDCEVFEAPRCGL